MLGNSFQDKNRKPISLLVLENFLEVKRGSLGGRVNVSKRHVVHRENLILLMVK